MSESLRYHNADVQEHLASHYVLGLQTSRVRRRTEALIRHIPELEKRIYDWQSQMICLHDNTPPVTPPDRVWQQLQRNLQNQSHGRPITQWWQNIFLWRTLTAACALIIATVFWWRTDTVSLQPIGYMAVMSEQNDSSRQPFVLTAYKGDAPGKSSLHLQWNQRLTTADLSGLTLWAVDINTGARQEIGQLQPVADGLLLTPAKWKAIQQSRELMVMKGNDIVYRGPCLELMPGQQDST